MAKTETDAWVPDLVPKGYELFNDYHRFVLCHGARKTGKSISVDTKVCRHLWENDRSVAGVICRTLRNGKVGVWRDFTQTVIPIWKEAGFGFDYSVRPRMEADSKMSYFRVRNMHGGESELQVHSLEHDEDVEARFKDTRFSLIYMVEADKFHQRHVFDVLTDQLRLGERGIAYHEHQFIADCNPPEEGDEHWLHDLFLKGRGLEPEFFANNFVNFYFPLEENQFIGEEEKNELRNKYRYDVMRYKRFVQGLWVRDSKRTVFHDVFLPNIHVAGDVRPDDDPDDPELIIPPPDCREIAVGADIGDMNHAMVFGCKRTVAEGPAAFDVIDEVVSVGKKIAIPDFVDLVMDRMEFWEGVMRQEYGVKAISWRFWSDSSSLRHKAIIGMNEALLIYRLSNGKISLKGVSKGAGSVERRIVLAKQMLVDGRLYVSAICEEVIRMFKNIRPEMSAGSEETDADRLQSAARHAYKLNIGDPLKHAFDALTYMLGYESPQSLSRSEEPRVVRTFAVS